MNKKVKTARLSILSNTSLIIMKLTVGLMTGSVSIISEAIHSSMDLAAAVIAFFSVKLSDIPADEDHPYGHGKVENISGVIEAILILLASFWIIFESIKKLFNPGEIHSIGIGFIVMFISAGVNFLVSKRLYKVAEEEDSIALKADALHLKADVITSLGVGFGLLIITITKLYFLDPIVALSVAVFILKEAVELLIHAFGPLLDIKLSDAEIAIIKEAIKNYEMAYCDFHRLRTRRSGSYKYIDMHMVFPREAYVGKAHDLCDRIEEEIEKNIKNTQVLIHIESCEKNCIDCQIKKDV